MTPIYIILLILYLLSNYLFNRLRYVLNFMTMTVGAVFLVNDFDSNIISDSDTKLAFLLSFVMYALMVFVNIYTSEE